MVRVTCSDKSCVYNSDGECKKSEIHIGTFLIGSKETGRAHIENVCRCYEKKGKKKDG